VLTKDFKTLVCDRFETAELAEFLQISIEDFVEMFEDEIEVNYEDIAEMIGLKDNNEDL
jgi:hypothetical protein